MTCIGGPDAGFEGRKSGTGFVPHSVPQTVHTQRTVNCTNRQRLAGETNKMKTIALGRLKLCLLDGDPRRICFDGVEVLRRVSYPVRDQSWGTHATETLEEVVTEAPGQATYTHRFQGRGGLFAGTFRAEISATPEGAVLRLSVALTAPAPVPVNRAGFTLLHPLRGVAGAALQVTHSDGTAEATTWPRLISPAQPVRDITGLAHVVNGVEVAITLKGDVFEMEDQRNWSDASYKTYCRPLALPLPYVLGPENPIRQEMVIALSGRADAEAEGDAAVLGVVPMVGLAAEPGLTGVATVPGLEGAPVVLRLAADCGAEVIAPFANKGPVTLEVVVAEGAAPDFVPLARACATAGLVPARVVALPAAYMKSHQPDGIWPDGPHPMDLIAPLRVAFAGHLVGGGMFTNFTEFNRCRPERARVDFVTYGSTAIVHAADDMSVLETLEALPDIHATGHAIAAGLPRHLGLFSIGMRSNPYAAACLPNPGRERLPMVMDDPRQDSSFAAVFAAGVLAGAGMGGVASLALAMTDGPLGAMADGQCRPVYHLIRFAQGLAGLPCRVALGDVIRIKTARGSIIANAGGDAVALPQAARGWLLRPEDRPGVEWLATDPVDLGGRELAPMALAFLTGDAE